MVKVNHMLLAKALLKAYGGLENRHYEWAFVYGSISPDCNPLTYFKGSIEHRFLHGHNYVNARRWMFRAIRRLQRRTHWHSWDYYTLGKITHYLADGFIYPHNEHYPYGPVEHRMYEVSFRSAFKTYIQDNPPKATTAGSDVIDAICKMHLQYMNAPSEVLRDMDYIVKSTLLVMASCLPGLPPPEALERKIVEAA